MRDIDWNLLKSFAYVVREGSLSAASRALNTTQPTIGRHIATLEEQIEFSLFTRSRDGLEPTEEALDLYPDVEAMLIRFDSFIRRLEGEKDDESGTVRIATSEVMGIEVFPDMLKKFHKSHPKIKVELSLSNKNENLLKRDADLAIRLNKPVQEALLAKFVGHVPLHFYAHKDYLKTNGTPKKFHELKDHVIIGPDREQEFLSSLRKSGIDIGREDCDFRLDNQVGQLELLRRGLGIGIMQKPLAKKSSALVPVLEKEFEYQMPVWAIMHEDLKTNSRVRLVYNFLIEEFQKYISGSSGQK
jgi:DNA-binding transcriptional LysR family regulator